MPTGEIASLTKMKDVFQPWAYDYGEYEEDRNFSVGPGENIDYHHKAILRDGTEIQWSAFGHGKEYTIRKNDDTQIASGSFRDMRFGLCWIKFTGEDQTTFETATPNEPSCRWDEEQIEPDGGFAESYDKKDTNREFWISSFLYCPTKPFYSTTCY